MSTWVALLRGINVGGTNRLPMAELRSCVEATGAHDVRTYIQSGNCVFRSDDGQATETATAERLALARSAEIERRTGLQMPVLVRSLGEVEQALADNPYPAASEQPATLHLCFLSTVPPAPNVAAMDALRGSDESFAFVGRVFYLHAPSGIGRSKLAAAMERHIAVPMTARNLRSVTQIVALAQRVRSAADGDGCTDTTSP